MNLRAIALRLAALAALLVSFASAEEADVAARTIVAQRQGDESELERLASLATSDPWLVVDELLRLDEPRAAAALITHVSDNEQRQRLRAYLNSNSRPRIDAAQRALLARAKVKRLANSPADGLALLGGIEAGDGSVFGVLVLHEKAMALRDLERKRESARAYATAAVAAHALGWRTRRNHLIRHLCLRVRVADAPYPVHLRHVVLDSAYLAKVRSALKASDAFVLYSEIHTTAVATVVTRERTDFVPLGEMHLLKRACDAVRNLTPKTAVRPDNARRLLIVPLRLPDSIKRLLIVPQRRLENVPFVLLAPALETSYLPWTKLWLIGEEQPRGQGILAIHDTLAPDPSKGQRYPEARALGTDFLGGRTATIAAFVDSVRRQRWRSIHLACPFESRSRSVVLAPGEKDLGLLGINKLIDLQVKADLLVFSGGHTANLSPSTGDGGAIAQIRARKPILKMSEREFQDYVKKMEKYRRRLKVFDIGPRFVADKNAPRAIVCLWDIDPQASSELMAKFYELWSPAAGKGIETAAALRKAQEFIRAQKRWRHPFYWAGWQLWGRPD